MQEALEEVNRQIMETVRLSEIEGGELMTYDEIEQVVNFHCQLVLASAPPTETGT